MDRSDFLTCLPIFKHLDTEAAQALSAELEEKRLPAGATLFTQGDPGDAIYLIVAGKLHIHVQAPDGSEISVSELGAGNCVGEMALLTGQPRSATVTVLQDCELLRLALASFECLTHKYPALLSGLANQLLPRFQQDQTKLALTHLFGKLDDELQQELLGKLGWRRIKSGQTLFHQGEPGEEMYVIVQGRLRLVVESNGYQRILGEVGAGECIGEFALLAEHGTPESLRSATIYATRMTDMIVITRAVFESLLCQYPQALLNLGRQIVRRATRVEKPGPIAESNLVIALVPTRPGQTLGEFGKQLTSSFTPLGTSLLFTAERFEQMYGKADASQTPLDNPLSLVINEWLDKREQENKYTIYDTTPVLDSNGHLTCWAQRCVEDADVILLVGEAGADPAPSAIEKALPQAASQARLELALLHPSNDQAFSGTAGWLKPRREGAFPVQVHHHVRSGNQSDLRRLARRIAGKPVGLSLAGGGARGWAHVGALQALEEANIEIDWISGASMGSIVAAGYALGWPCERFRELAVRFSNPKKLLDYTFPYASVTATRYITSLLQDLYGDANIEDTLKPFFCISANLTESKEYIHTCGALWKAVRASMALPAVFAPILEDGCVLIDGGATNNLPVDRMREMMPSGKVIGVELITGSSVSGPYNFGPSLSGWSALISHFLPAANKIVAPNLLDIVNGLVESTNRFHLNEVRHCADLLIKVPVQEFGLLEFDRHARIIEAGYCAAQEQLKGFQPA